MEKVIRFFKDESGVTSVEYGLMAAVIALGILASTQGLRDWIIGRFNAVAAIP